MKMISLKKQKHGYLVHTWSDNAFKGTVRNQNQVSLEITDTLKKTKTHK